MNIVMIVPTGVGAEIGGHNGDANPAAKLLGAACDTLIVHPNVVNGSDINEMPSNALYVDGYMLDRFLSGEINLKPGYNRNILVVTNSPVKNETVNAVSASRVTLGIDIEIMELKIPLQMIAEYDLDGTATGEVLGWEELVEQVRPLDFDALAITTPIEVDIEVAEKYYRNGGVNPWGGIEAKASRLISTEIPKPVAHAPVDTGMLKDFKEIVDPRIAPEMLSETFLHSVLKGLHRAPQIGGSLSVQDIDFLVSPDGCWGYPHQACIDHGVDVLMVKENKTVLDIQPAINEPRAKHVSNYLEAVGVIVAKRAGIKPDSVRRPLRSTIVRQL